MVIRLGEAAGGSESTDAADSYGCGLSFTIGDGNDLVCQAATKLSNMLIGRGIDDIFANLGEVCNELTRPSQLVWVGPDAGVIHLAAAAIINALWDLRARIAGQPLWMLLATMPPEQLVASLDFSGVTDMLSPDEAIAILKAGEIGKAERIAALARPATHGGGYPAYTTSPGWTGLDDETMVRLTKEALAEGFDTVKIKVGRDLEEDKRRLRLCRDALGPDNRMGTDANQVFEVGQAIEWMRALAAETSEGGLPVAPLFIEEPLSPHDAVGHSAIREALKDLGIGVATGEQCANRVMWKQMFALGAVDIAQPDFARLAGASEFVLVLLMARKCGVATWPHAGGVGLCEGVQHLMLFDAAAVSALDDPWGSGRRAEFVDHLHDKFVDPCRVVNGRYEAPTKPGFSLEMFPAVVAENVFPTGPAWAALLASGGKAVPTAADAVATAVKSADGGPSAMGATASTAATTE